MAGLGTVLGCFSGFRGKLLFLAGVLTVLGVGLNSLHYLEPEKGVRAAGTEESTISSGLAKTTRTLAEYSRSTTWGDAAIRIGLSFGIAMIFASLLRAFLKTMITFVLLAAIVCWFLHTRGLIEPFWEDYRFSLGEAENWIAGQFYTIKEFVGGVLPSAGAAVTGFVLGLRK